jgi:hypothetical protein
MHEEELLQKGTVCLLKEQPILGLELKKDGVSGKREKKNGRKIHTLRYIVSQYPFVLAE